MNPLNEVNIDGSFDSSAAILALLTVLFLLAWAT
jgi:hypothetical protein